jgi:hypothetical protein
MPILPEEGEYESLLLSLLNLYPNNHLRLFTSLIPVYQSNFFFHVYSKLRNFHVTISLLTMMITRNYVYISSTIKQLIFMISTIWMTHECLLTILSVLDHPGQCVFTKQCILSNNAKSFICTTRVNWDVWKYRTQNSFLLTQLSWLSTLQVALQQILETSVWTIKHFSGDI